MTPTEIAQGIDSLTNKRDISISFTLTDGRTFNGVLAEPAFTRTGERKFAVAIITLTEGALSDPDVTARRGQISVSRDGENNWSAVSFDVWDPDATAQMNHVGGVDSISIQSPGGPTPGPGARSGSTDITEQEAAEESESAKSESPPDEEDA